jgi:hypothetical protein
MWPLLALYVFYPFPPYALSIVTAAMLDDWWDHQILKVDILSIIQDNLCWNWPNGFRGEDFKNSLRMDAHDGHQIMVRWGKKMSGIPTLKIEMVILLWIFNSYITYLNWGCRGRDHTVVGFTPGIPVFSTNNTELHDITEMGIKYHKPNPNLNTHIKISLPWNINRGTSIFLS